MREIPTWLAGRWTGGARVRGRRDFLRGLASLPLIGGSVVLIGQPSAIAKSATVYFIGNYKTWLDREMSFYAGPTDAFDKPAADG